MTFRQQHDANLNALVGKTIASVHHDIHGDAVITTTCGLTFEIQEGDGSDANHERLRPVL